MILGILDADTLRDDLKAQYVSYAYMVQVLIENAVGAPNNQDITYKTYRVIEGEYPKRIDECDAYLVTGSKSSAYDDDDWIAQLKVYVQSVFQKNKKILGICFGHQLIAMALGGDTRLASHGWGVGVHQYQTTKAGRKLFLPQRLSLLVSHRDQVVVLPKDAQLLAYSEFCPNAAYKITDQVLCFQGHPEFTAQYADALMQARKDIIPPETFELAQDSLKDPTHDFQVARVLAAFVQ